MLTFQDVNVDQGATSSQYVVMAFLNTTNLTSSVASP